MAAGPSASARIYSRELRRTRRSLGGGGHPRRVPPLAFGSRRWFAATFRFVHVVGIDSARVTSRRHSTYVGFAELDW